MRRMNIVNRFRRAAAILSAAMVFQLGGCDLGSIQVTQTIETRQLVIDLINGAILGPIQTFVTDAVNNAFGVED